MDYKKATLQHIFRGARKYKNSIDLKLSELPKGWIYMTKKGYYDTMTPEERETDKEIIRNREIQRTMDAYVSTFIKRTREKMELDCFYDYEIDEYIENLFYDESYEYDDENEYIHEEEYDSSDSYEY
jgi:NAD+--asparagine ADP-ribosyltransferase